jgi:hypothetical protein
MHSTSKIKKGSRSRSAYGSFINKTVFLFDAIKQTGDFSHKADGGNDSTRLTQHKPILSHAWYMTVNDFPLTIFSSPTMHLLTLDPTTLFYWNISKIHNPLS